MQRKLNHSLERFLIETNAFHVVFATKSGEVLEHRGMNFGINIFSMTALLTGVFNTTVELAKLVDECDFNQFFLKGREWKLFYQDVASLFILIVLFRERTLLGTVRMSSERFAYEVKRMFEMENIIGTEISVLGGEGGKGEELLEEFFKE